MLAKHSKYLALQDHFWITPSLACHFALRCSYTYNFFPTPQGLLSVGKLSFPSMYFIPFPILQKKIMGESTGCSNFHVIGLLNRTKDSGMQLQSLFFMIFFSFVSNTHLRLTHWWETLPCPCLLYAYNFSDPSQVTESSQVA